MRFNDHSTLAGLHAKFGASKYHWTNYDEEKFIRVFHNLEAARRGDRLHALAKECIDLRVKLAGKNTLSMYVNDAIGLRMRTEQVVFFSENFFGTVDAIQFNRKKLRVHDLKTGDAPTSVRQLEIYAAWFCLEYGHSPFEIGIELRIYQNNECQIYDADPTVIFEIMEKTKFFESIIKEQRGDFE